MPKTIHADRDSKQKDITFHQSHSQIDKQIVAGGNIHIGQVGDKYEIAQAQILMTQAFAKEFAKFWAKDQQSDYTELLDKASWEPETVLVQAGSFLMGCDSTVGIPMYETPQLKMSLPTYRIGKYPVTNEQYCEFISDKKLVPPTQLGWRGNEPKRNQYDLPVKGVTWYGALAYCAWLTAKTERPYTLPSELQWEKAARGTDGRIFPWGNEWRPEMCNVDCKTVTSIFDYEAAQSPSGCLDMVGNVREWTSTTWGRKRKPFDVTLQNKYPAEFTWKPNQTPDKIDENRQIRRITRGGAALISHLPLRATRRQSELPYRRGVRFSETGFRVALNWNA